MNALVLKLFNLASFVYLIVTSVFIADFMGGAMEQVYVMPAPYAFSIWGLIYLLLLWFVVKSFFADEELDRVVKGIGLWFPISMILSGTSVVVGTNPSILFIALSLLTLCVVYTIIQGLGLSSTNYRVPFSIYLGWTSIATIVAAFVAIKGNGIEEILSIGELGWAVIMLTAGGLIALAFHFLQKDYLFPLVFVWGYVAIYLYQDSALIKFITGGFAALLLIILCVNWFKTKGK
ncbi:tryptophan-rich sensory protein [Pontibacillus salipaludis]|uniref:tryptophan-rich sensory protein n=1 Tax=Pontibacillus salipaludis TaxID=1697394 RepID=UPI0031E6F5D7